MFINSPKMGLKVPIVGVTEGTKWAEYVNVSFEVIDLHDHSIGSGNRITQAGIKFNDTFDWNLQGGKNCDFISFQDRVTDPDPRSIYFKNQDLYIKTGSGGVIQLTIGGGFNTQLSGGIGGDYGTTAALVSYNDFDKTYLFESDASGVYANIQTGSITVYQQDSNVLDFGGVELQASNLTSSAGYTYTFPASLPGFNGVVVVDEFGQWSYHEFDDLVTVNTNQTIIGIKTFSNGIISNVTGDLTGNADTATILQTTRTINGIDFNGSMDIEVPHNNAPDLQGGIVTERYHLTEQEHIEATRYADVTQSGLLTASDWDVFNKKVEEAPSNGNQQVRIDGVWADLIIDGGEET